MRTRSQVLRRINTLYIVFFVAIALALVSGFLSDDFKAGYTEGRQTAEFMTGQGDSAGQTGKFRTIFYGLHNKTSQHAYQIPIELNAADGTKAVGRIDTFEVMLSSESIAGSQGLIKPFAWGWNIVLLTLSMLCYGAVFVMILIILTSVRRSIRRDDIFARSNIIRSRAIGILLVGASLLNSVAEWLQGRAAAALIAPSGGISIDTAFRFSFTEIITAILILFIAEIFAIGYDLTQEQKLTI